MPRLSCPRRASFVALAALSIAAVAACGPSQVAPTSSTSEPAPAVSSPIASTSAEPATSGAPGSPGPNASQGAVVATPVPPDDPNTTPPPAGDPQDDEACLAIVPRADVEAAIGVQLGDIVALGTDPALNLSCTYATAAGESLLVSTTAGDAATAFQSSFEVATGYSQHPKAIEGLGDMAFYAVAADRWPEQVVVAKGPVLLRLVNQTSTTIGEEAFTTLAQTAAEAIRAEIPPAP